jgi:hypothetical protein
VSVLLSTVIDMILLIDTFELEGGSNFEIAQNIANVAQQSGSKGWSQLDGNQNRFFLINDMLSPTYSAIRKQLLNIILV